MVSALRYPGPTPLRGLRGHAAAESQVVARPFEPNPRSLERLARLLQRRYAPSSGRCFVMLAADLGRARGFITDDLATQPMPVMR
jgi:hypothetical protein